MIGGWTMRRAWERWWHLHRADLLLVSPPKCGRSWLRVMLAHHWHECFGTPLDELPGSSRWYRLPRHIPRLFHTHVLNEPASLRRLFGPRLAGRRPVLLLVRDPRDALLSLHRHFRFCSRRTEWQRFGLGEDPGQLSLERFLRHPRIGLPAFLALYDRLAAFLDRHPRCLLLRYEDLRADPAASFARLLGFLGEPTEPQAVARTVAFASLEHMRALEAEGFFRSEVLRPADPAEGRSFKVGLGKSGRWREELPAELGAELAAMIGGRLDPRFGYGS